MSTVTASGPSPFSGRVLVGKRTDECEYVEEGKKGQTVTESAEAGSGPKNSRYTCRLIGRLVGSNFLSEQIVGLLLCRATCFKTVITIFAVYVYSTFCVRFMDFCCCP